MPDIFTHAACGHCGWQGKREDMKDDPNSPLDELCPQCGSADTGWHTETESELFESCLSGCRTQMLRATRC